MHKIIGSVFIIIVVVFIGAPISYANWKLVYTDVNGDFYMETESVYPVKDDYKLYADMWTKQVHSAASLDDLANKATTEELKVFAYNLKYIISHIQIYSKEHQYRALKRVLYDKNDKVMHVYEFIEPWHEYHSNSAIDAMEKEFLKLCLIKVNQNN